MDIPEEQVAMLKKNILCYVLVGHKSTKILTPRGFWVILKEKEVNGTT